MWEEWQSYYQDNILASGEGSWMIYVFITVFITLCVSFFVGFTLKRLEARLDKNQRLWDDALVSAIRYPLRVVIWVVGISIAAEIIYEQTKVPVFESVPKLREILFIIIMGWAFLRFTKKGAQAIVEERRKRNKNVDLTTMDAITNLLKASIVITTFLIVLQSLGYSINAVLTFGGIGGIAVGFAAKDMLANFFGAMMIYMDRPFNVGDWIRSPDREIEGTVEQIGWRMTTIRTFDKRPLYVPNAVFTQIAVENPSRMSHRRIFETIGIRYDDISQMSDITHAVRRMLEAHEQIDETQTLIVHFNAFNASSCDFFIYTFTHTTNWIKFHEVKEDVLLKISDIIAEHNAEIAFPTQTLHVAQLEAIAGEIPPSEKDA